MGAPSGKQGRAVSRKQGIRAHRLLARAPPRLQGTAVPVLLAGLSGEEQSWIRPCGHVLPGAGLASPLSAFKSTQS